ncbi:hypothetical protein ACHAWF_005409 [Thalassiosira exigua]
MRPTTRGAAEAARGDGGIEARAMAMAIMETETSIRTIDDFLDQVYHEYERRLPQSPEETGGTSSRIPSRVGSIRHCFPLPLLALCVANSSDATEILMVSYLLACSAFRRDMASDGGEEIEIEMPAGGLEAGFLAGSIFMGMLLGGTLLGFLSDHIGRRPSLLAGLLVNATAGLVSSVPFFTPTIVQLTAWRFIAGIGVGATVPSLFSLASEWSPKEVRGAVVTLVASFWMVGSLFVAGLGWILFRGDQQDDERGHSAFPVWRVFAASCALPSALGAWMVHRHVPESPRFLAFTKNEWRQSANACNTMAKALGVKLTKDADDTALFGEIVIEPLTEDELRQDYSLSICNEHTNIGSPLIERIPRAIQTLVDTLQKLYCPQLLTRTTLPLQSIWFFLSFGTYGITTWINTLFVAIHLRSIYFNSFLFALANFPGNLISIFYSDKWGRKRMLVGSLLGAATGLGGFALLVYFGPPEEGEEKGDESSAKSFSDWRMYGIVFSACFFQAFSTVSWNAMDILTGELFPTEVRSAGMGVCTASGRFGAMIAQVVNARLMTAGSDEGCGSVVAIAASTLLVAAGMGAGMPRDMALIELKDEVQGEATSGRRVALGCIGNSKGQKDHLSDDEADNGGLSEYQSFQQEAEPFML